jgi:hypothetical protein
MTQAEYKEQRGQERIWRKLDTQYLLEQQRQSLFSRVSIGFFPFVSAEIRFVCCECHQTWQCTWMLADLQRVLAPHLGQRMAEDALRAAAKTCPHVQAFAREVFGLKVGRPPEEIDPNRTIELQPPSVTAEQILRGEF